MKFEISIVALFFLVHGGTGQERFNCNDRNPCTQENINNENFYFANDHPCKYVQCSEYGRCWSMPCAPGTQWNQTVLTCVHASLEICNAASWNGSTDGSTSGGYNCGSNNPCTDVNVAANKFYFPNYDPCKFVQCNEFKECWVMPCAPGTKWSVEANTCIHAESGTCGSRPGNPNDPTSGYNCGSNNPCTDANVAANKFYFPNYDPCKFVQCNEFKECWVMPCAPGTKWSVEANTCIHAESGTC